MRTLKDKEMKKLETALIKCKDRQLLSALGQKQVDRIIRKAVESNGLNRYQKEAKPIVEKVINLVRCLIFEHKVTKEQLSQLQKSIKVVNNKLELPEHFLHI